MKRFQITLRAAATATFTLILLTFLGTRSKGADTLEYRNATQAEQELAVEIDNYYQEHLELNLDELFAAPAIVKAELYAANGELLSTIEVPTAAQMSNLEEKYLLLMTLDGTAFYIAKE